MIRTIPLLMAGLFWLIAACGNEVVPLVKLPQDEGAHETPLEWWYFNGHLTDETGKTYSYHFVTFEAITPDGVRPRLLQLSWSDHSEGVYLTDEKPALAQGPGTSTGFDINLEGWRMQGDGASYGLDFATGGYALELTATPTKPPALHQGTGLVDLGRAGESFYYTRSRLKTQGFLEVEGERRRVEGISWMDHQWGDFSTLPVGWDWFSLQLDDQSEVMVSVVWDREERTLITTYGTYIPATPASEAQQLHLKEKDIKVIPTGSWRSPANDTVYPLGWELEIAPISLKVTIAPVLEKAEFSNSKYLPSAYWEGAVSVKGTKNGQEVGGKGFAELVGYAPDRPGSIFSSGDR